MRIIISTALSLLMFIWSSIVYGSQTTALTLGGTGSALEVMRLLGENYSAGSPDVTFKILPSLGTAGGIRAVSNGALDLAVASRQLNDKEKEGLKVVFLGESPFVFAVHPATEVENVTLAEVATLYKGTFTTWRNGIPVRRIVRPHNDSDWQLMSGLSPELAEALEIAEKNEELFLAITDTDAVSYLERVPGSFGPSTLTMILAEKRNVKILSFNGIEAGITDPGKREYPLVKPYYLLARAEASVAVDAFIAFIRSDQGRQILAQTGIMPASEQSQAHEQ